MPTVGPFAMINHRFVVDCDDDAVADRLSATLGDVTTDGGWDVRYAVISDDEAGWDVRRDDVVLALGVDVDRAVDALCTEANRLGVDSSDAAGVLHAGAVVRDGHAVVVVGESGVGKTTLVTRLLADGWGYLTDEAVQLTADGQVLAYPKPLVHKVEEEGILVRRHTLASTLGTLATGPVPVAGILLLGVDQLGLATDTPGQRMVALCKLAFDVGPARACVDVLAALVERLDVTVLPARPAQDVADRAIAHVMEAAAGYRRGR